MPGNPDQTYYETLNVAGNASADEIDAAYKSLKEQYQASQDPAARDMLAGADAAYGILRDPGKRAAYNQTLRPKDESDKPIEPKDNSAFRSYVIQLFVFGLLMALFIALGKR